MTRPAWIAPAYGYIVCVIAVVTFLISVQGFVDAAFDRANPLAGRNAYGPYGNSMTSFEAFLATGDQVRSMRVAGPGGGPADTLSMEELRTRYEALRDDRILQTRYQATQAMTKRGLLILLAIALFVTHWRWLRRQTA